MTGTVTKKKTTITLTTGTTTGFFANDAVSDSAAAIPKGAVITSVTNSTSFVISARRRRQPPPVTPLRSPRPRPSARQGYTSFAQENPFNDVLTVLPPNGATNGIQQLEDQGTHATGATSKGVAINVAPLDLASSARAPALTGSTTGDDRGLNFVAYAQDAVDWIHWTSVSGTATPSSAVTNLTPTELTSIYEDQGCTRGRHELHHAQLGLLRRERGTHRHLHRQRGFRCRVDLGQPARPDGHLPVRQGGPEPRHLPERDVVDPGQPRPG